MSVGPFSLEEHLFEACRHNRISQVRDLLRNNPEIDINTKSNSGWSPLYIACFCSHSEVVSALLEHPAVDPNMGVVKETAVKMVCRLRRTKVIDLLKDSRVLVDDGTPDTPLWFAASSGFVEAIEYLIAYHPEFEAGVVCAKCQRRAEEKRHTEAAGLLASFMADPGATRHALWVKMGLVKSMASEVFALVVLLCDDFVALRGEAETGGARFFGMVRMLPLELQMLMCWRVYRSSRENITGRDLDVGLKKMLASFEKVK